MTQSGITLEHIPKPKRLMAPVRWVGGKGQIVAWIVNHLPPRDGIKAYCEPFCGAASVFWRLPQPYPVEVLNDKDERLITIFRVLQDREKFQEFRHRIIWTPYSLAEFTKALEMLDAWEELSDVDRAWAFFVALNQGFGGKIPRSAGNWGRGFCLSRNMAMNCNSWRGRMKMLDYWHDRLTRVQIDCRDALEVIEYWDSPETLFYVDPPYVLDTRKTKDLYENEMSDEEHERLIELLLNVKGKVALSGYDNDIYKVLEENGWRRAARETVCNVAGRIRGSKLVGEGNAMKHAKRVEVLWMNYDSLPLFGV